MQRLILLLVLVAGGRALAQPVNNDLDFLTNHVDGRETRLMLPRYLKSKANALLDARAAEVAKITTVAAIDARRALVRQKLQKSLGGAWPAKTPLNARTVATLDFADYRVEKVIYESQPKFYVTASLYLPKNVTGRRPAILFPLGHEEGAKAHDAWQHVLVTFARRGYVCFAWDTLGQGERLQFWDADLRASKVGNSTIEHTIIGLQTLLMGDPLGRYTIWDGIRAMDYLLSRPEVDPARVGLTGNSGGGTHTAYLGAMDGDRFAAAAPSCFITSWRRLLDTIGPQDAEQCIPYFLSDGLDHGDFILSFAPKPYQMLVAIRDFFSIEGARATAADIRRVYDGVGREERFGLFEADDGHGYTAPRRGQAYRFFSRWLEGRENPEPEAAVRVLPEEQLYCTRSGQVMGELADAESVHSLNLKRLAALRGTVKLDAVAGAMAFAPSTAPVRVTPMGGTAAVRKLLLETEPGIRLPGLLYAPANAGAAKPEGVVLAYGAGKAAAHAEALRRAAAGQLVLSLDLRGLGETRPVTVNYGSDWTRWFGDYESAQTAILTGKPLAAMRAEDIARAVEWLAPQASGVRVVARDGAAIPALLAAAADARITHVRVERMLESWESLLRDRIHRQQWENAIPGVLRSFDLPDVVKALGRRVEVVEPVDARGVAIRR